jgi:hypothetical protein
MRCGTVAILHLVPALSCGCEGAGENRALTTFIAMMMASEHRSLVEGIACGLSSTSLSCSGGTPISWCTGSDDGDSLCLSPS